MKTVKAIILLGVFFTIVICISSFTKDETSIKYEYPTKLSDMKVFTGALADLNPVAEYKLYEMNTMLFSDSAEKQRLIKLPAGKMMTAVNNGLPTFPEGTILAKTFFYYKDKSKPEFYDEKNSQFKGKIVIETRLLTLINNKWIGGTYSWDADQKNATLISTGVDIPVTWVDQTGVKNDIEFHVTSNKECFTCHNSEDAIVPIGPKIKSMNLDVMRDGKMVNQLTYFQKIGILNPMKPTAFSMLPKWKDRSLPDSVRARAYMDVNCAYCHSSKGYAASSFLELDYETPLADSYIKKKGKKIISLMEMGLMPKVGTTIVDQEALAVIKRYIESLPK